MMYLVVLASVVFSTLPGEGAMGPPSQATKRGSKGTDLGKEPADHSLPASRVSHQRLLLIHRTKNANVTTSIASSR